MTQEELLKQIQERVSKATKGPCRTTLAETKHSYPMNPVHQVQIEGPDREKLAIGYAWGCGEGITLDQVRANAKLWAASHSDIPALLSIIQKQREALEIFGDGSMWLEHADGLLEWRGAGECADPVEIAQAARSYVPEGVA